MALSNVLEEIKKVQPYAVEDVDAGPAETLVGRRGRKNRAIESLKTLRSQYQRELLESAAFIIVTGEKRKEFAAAAETFGCFEANANAYYEDLANRIPEVLYQGKESVSNLFDILGRHIEDKNRELSIHEYPQVIFKQQYRITIKEKADLVGLIRQDINEQMGSEIVGIQSVSGLTDAAIAKEHGAKVTPIILTVDTETLALDLERTLNRLRPRGVFLVVSGKGTKNLRAVPNVISVKDPANTEEVEKVLKTISGVAKR